MKKKLNPKQELFCKLYATDRDCFGNGVQAYLKVYSTKKKPISYKAARVSAFDLLTKPNICDRIREQIDIYISDEVVDKELGMVILQYADIPSKVAAVREYNKVKSRVINKFEILDPNAEQTDDNLTDEERRIVGEIRKREEKSKDKAKTKSS